MSRLYEMSVEESAHNPAKVTEIQAAAGQEWPFDDWWLSDDNNQQETTMYAWARTHWAGARVKRSLPSGCPWPFGGPTGAIARSRLTPPTWRTFLTRRTHGRDGLRPPDRGQEPECRPFGWPSVTSTCPAMTTRPCVESVYGQIRNRITQ